jgi:hypothetical protein
MNFTKKISMLGGAGALAGILVIAIAPNTAHGLVATLVQVSNTTANPVPTQDIRESASQILELSCPTYQEGNAPCVQDDPNNPSRLAFTVPVGQHFVITKIEASCSGGGTETLYVDFPISDTGGSIFSIGHGYEFPCNSTTVQFNLQPGLVFNITGVPMDVLVNKLTDLPTIVRGYLTAN